MARMRKEIIVPEGRRTNDDIELGEEMCPDDGSVEN
jgi:hypothetical protein